jgi:hypothetical protein
VAGPRERPSHCATAATTTAGARAGRIRITGGCAAGRGGPRRNRALRGRSGYGFGSPFVLSKPAVESLAHRNELR